jgi:hypothetical protein
MRPFRVVAVAAVLFSACTGGSPETSSTTTPDPVSTATEAPVLEPSTATTTAPEPQQQAWSEADAEKHVANYLAALAAGAYEQAAWPAANNGVDATGAEAGETPAETMARWCEGGRCSGPYTVEATGPGLVDPESQQASSAVIVTHTGSGESATLSVATFEGQILIYDPPPLVSAPGGPGLVESLFGETPPARVVVERYDAFEIWEEGSPRWVTNWHAESTWDVEADVIVADSGAYGLDQPEVRFGEACSGLMMRDGEVLAAACGGGMNWDPVVVKTGEMLEAPVPLEELTDGGFLWFDERGGTVVTGVGDAEGNSRIVSTTDGVDLAGGDYVGFTALSTDGSLFAYTDHDDPAAVSHFWSPVVVVKETVTGTEVGRWTLDGVVVNLELSAGHLLAGIAEAVDAAVDGNQAALISIDLRTSEIRRVETSTRVFLPAVGEGAGD